MFLCVMCCVPVYDVGSETFALLVIIALTVCGANNNVAFSKLCIHVC
jgi:hypothetical protein